MKRRDYIHVAFLIGLLFGVGLVAGYSLSNTSPVDGSVPLASSSGPTVTLNASSATVNLSRFTGGNIGSQTVWVQTQAGNASFNSAGATNVTVEPGNLTGTFTSVTGLDVTSADLTINPADKNKATVGDNATHFSFRSTIELDDGVVDFKYGGNTGTTKVTVRGVQANKEIDAVDSSGTVQDTSNSNSNGVVTFTGMSNSDHTITLQSGSKGTVAQGTGWCNRAQLEHYLTNMSGQDPVKAVACPFIQDEGLGMGIIMFSMFFFGFIGMGLSYRVQHPGPLLVAGILTAGVVTLTIPSVLSTILTIVIFFGLSMLGIYLYQRAQGEL